MDGASSSSDWRPRCGAALSLGLHLRGLPPDASWRLMGSANRLPLRSPLFNAESVHICVCVHTYACACVCETTFFPSEERDLGCWLCPGWAVGGRPLPGAGGQVPSLVLLLEDLRRNKKESERLAGMCLCLGGWGVFSHPHPSFSLRLGIK